MRENIIRKRAVTSKCDDPIISKTRPGGVFGGVDANLRVGRRIYGSMELWEWETD